MRFSFEHTSWLLNFQLKVALVVRRLELLELALLRERRLLILFILVRIGIARVRSLICWIAFVGRLEWNLSDASFVPEESEVSAASPGEDGEEGEHDGAGDAATAADWIR